MILGIDPGIGGGIAALTPEAAAVLDVPTLVREVNGKSKRRIDPAGLARVLSGLDLRGALAFVERAQATPQMGVSSAFGYGEAFGLVVGVLAHAGVEMRFVAPGKWKRDMGLVVKGNRSIGEEGHAYDKEPALELARKLYPQLRAELIRAKDNGRADALLIAHWGCEQLESERLPLLSPAPLRPARRELRPEIEF
jgi:crossover junction endodeoxyribonuclease RuvC